MSPAVPQRSRLLWTTAVSGSLAIHAGLIGVAWGLARSLPETVPSTEIAVVSAPFEAVSASPATLARVDAVREPDMVAVPLPTDMRAATRETKGAVLAPADAGAERIEPPAAQPAAPGPPPAVAAVSSTAETASAAMSAETPPQPPAKVLAATTDRPGPLAPAADAQPAERPPVEDLAPAAGPAEVLEPSAAAQPVADVPVDRLEEAYRGAAALARNEAIETLTAEPVQALLSRGLEPPPATPETRQPAARVVPLEALQERPSPVRDAQIVGSDPGMAGRRVVARAASGTAGRPARPSIASLSPAAEDATASGRKAALRTAITADRATVATGGQETGRLASRSGIAPGIAPGIAGNGSRLRPAEGGARAATQMAEAIRAERSAAERHRLAGGSSSEQLVGREVAAGRGVSDRALPANQAHVADFVRSFPGGTCFFPAPVMIGDAIGFEAFAADRKVVTDFTAQLAGQLGMPAEVAPRDVSRTQCSALDFARSLPRFPAYALVLDVRQSDVESGSTLSGTVSNAGQRAVHLLLIDDHGDVQSATGHLGEPDGDRRTFELSVSLKAGAVPTLQLLLAVATDRDLAALSGPDNRSAGAFFAELAEEIRRTGADVDIAMTGFGVRSRFDWLAQRFRQEPATASPAPPKIP